MTIRTKADYRYYLAEDMRACDPALASWRPWHAIKYPTLAWQRKLRLAEFMINRSKGPLSKALAFYFRYRARKAGIRLGFSIPPNVFGPGLCLVHWGTIVVNNEARVGARCRLHPCTVIGGRATGAPRLGDDCYIGPGAKLMGNIEIGDHVRIGANAVVNKSFPAASILVGVPARALPQRGVEEVI